MVSRIWAAISGGGARGPSAPRNSISPSVLPAPPSRAASSAASRRAAGPDWGGAVAGLAGMAARVRQSCPTSWPKSRNPEQDIGVLAASARRKRVGGIRSRASRPAKARSKAARSGRASMSCTRRPTQASAGLPRRLCSAPAAKRMRPSGVTSNRISAAAWAKVRNRSRSVTRLACPLPSIRPSPAWSEKGGPCRGVVKAG
jgi:hypothetical protein